jgi:hypothetical protein
MLDFANRAIALDNRLFNFRTLRTRHESQYYQNIYPRAPQQESASSDPEPMELYATQSFRLKDKSEEEKRRRNNECYNCGKMGHYAPRCPTRKLNQDQRPYRAIEAILEEQLAKEEAGKADPQE